MPAHRSILDRDSPREALDLAADETAAFDLLVTDVIMPELNGPELAGMLRADQPELSVLYISGYTDDVMISRGALPPSTAFLQQPFSVDELQRALREILDERTASPASSQPQAIHGAR